MSIMCVSGFRPAKVFLCDGGGRWINAVGTFWREAPGDPRHLQLSHLHLHNRRIDSLSY